ncbi:PolC-type DNA polymerase III [Candidatus Electronema sp. JM]|uniref:3'-5' exonuclease n=1 Tax=Candidatus Electronema sp. JM TaxID=3401571 RepID=UPI003AA7EBB6
MFAFLHTLLQRPELHPVLLENRRYFAEFDQGRPLTDCRFVAFDTELTGLGRRDEIISIGAVKISKMQIEMDHVFNQLVRPANLSPNQATFIHHITPEQLREAPTLEEVLPQFVEFCGDALLLGHFVEIDMGYLNRAARKILGGTLANPTVDTLRLVKAYKETSYICDYGYCDQSFSCNLDELITEFNLPRFKPHDALEDALQCAYLFLFLAKKLNNGEIKTLRQLYQAGQPLLLRQN